ncbi:DUF3039 domain-containing protein [Candidatus Poriferisodalis sp.]|uniref:DUF3039 domain-containing protein n=1 Tax=Candidatus Poriferisodalis sp. TaxID=3101277 RepID=UPI003D0A75AA
MGTETVVDSPESDTLVDERPSDGAHDRFSHYVDKVQLTRSAVTGEAVIALCGKRWVPTREGERYPVCPACREIYAGLRS